MHGIGSAVVEGVYRGLQVCGRGGTPSLAGRIRLITSWNSMQVSSEMIEVSVGRSEA